MSKVQDVQVGQVLEATELPAAQEQRLLEAGHEVRLRQCGLPHAGHVIPPVQMQTVQRLTSVGHLSQCTGNTYEHRVCKYSNLLLWNDTFYYPTTGEGLRHGCLACHQRVAWHEHCSLQYAARGSGKYLLLRLSGLAPLPAHSHK